MKSLQVLTIGDPHFKVDNIIESDEMTDKLIKLVKHINPTFVVVLGDILHRHEKIHVSPLMRAGKLIKLLSEICPTYLLIGNHDRPNNSTYMTDEHPFNPLKYWENTYIVDNNVLDHTIDGHRFLFVPYVFPGLFDKTLSTIDQPLNETTAIFAHQEFYGAKMGAIVSQVGDKWPKENPLVISGHIHDYDKLQDNLIYVGTPMQHAYSPHANDKTVSLFTFSKGVYKEDRVELGLKKKKIVYLTPEKFHTYQPPDNILIKIVIRGDESSLKAISKMEKIKEFKKLGIKISYKRTKYDDVDNNETKISGPILRFKYKDRLHSSISKDKLQLEWFNKLFN